MLQLCRFYIVIIIECDIVRCLGIGDVTSSAECSSIVFYYTSNA